MGSSHGTDYENPDIPAPSGVMTPTPQPQPRPPVDYPSFLPGNPGAMATGLTPAMFKAIDANAGPSAGAAPSTPSGQAASAPPGPAAGGTGMPPDPSANLPPDLRQKYLDAKASGNDALAARILLAAKMMGSTRIGGDDRSGYTTSGPGSGGATSSARSPMGGGLL